MLKKMKNKLKHLQRFYGSSTSVKRYSIYCEKQKKKKNSPF